MFESKAGSTVLWTRQKMVFCRSWPTQWFLFIALTITATTAPAGPGDPGDPGAPPSGPQEYTTDLETQLRHMLFTGYETLQRPGKNVEIDIALNLMSIGYLDIKEQKLSISGYLTVEWDDSRLQWEANDTYSNIQFLFTSENNIWRPALIMENSVDDIDVISKPNVLMRIIENGRIVWTPGGVYVTSCESDITYYPLDIQHCDIVISTWSYTANEVSLRLYHDEEAILMTYFQENGEWEVVGLSAASESSKRESQSFSRLRFSLSLRRRPLFHLLNTIFPVILMAFLTVVVFKLPVESGERIGLSLTVLLAYAVYLTLISDNIPQTSLSASILSTYLAVILLLSTFSVILTIVVLDIYFQPEERRVPNWLQTLTKKVLVRLVCWDRYHGQAGFQSKISRLARHTSVSPEPVTGGMVRLTSHRRKPSVPALKKTKAPDVTFFDDAAIDKDRQSPDGGWCDSEDEDGEYSWKEIASIVDKCFLYLFLFLVTTVTVVCMGLIAAQYHASYRI